MESNTTMTKVCTQCGAAVKHDAAFCSHCGTMVANSFLQNSQWPINNNFTVEKKPLKRCAWFAPVAVVISSFLGLITNFLATYITSNTHISNSGQYYVYAVNNILSFLIKCAVIYVFFLIATSNVSKIKTKTAMMTVFFVYFFGTVPSVISSVIHYTLLGLYFNHIIKPLSITLINNFATVLTGVLTILIAILSYFITAKYFSFIDKSINTSDNTASPMPSAVPPCDIYQQ